MCIFDMEPSVKSKPYEVFKLAVQFDHTQLLLELNPLKPTSKLSARQLTIIPLEPIVVSNPIAKPLLVTLQFFIIPLGRAKKNPRVNNDGRRVPSPTTVQLSII